mgnify:CR=1 FL=1
MGRSTGARAMTARLDRVPVIRHEDSELLLRALTSDSDARGLPHPADHRDLRTRRSDRRQRLSSGCARQPELHGDAGQSTAPSQALHRFVVSPGPPRMNKSYYYC